MSLGSEVIVLMLVWLNIMVVVEVYGGWVVILVMEYDGEGWRLDVEKLEWVVMFGISVIFLNLFCNLIGWVVDEEVL